MKNLIKEFYGENRGSTAVEYGFISALVGIAITVSLVNLGSAVNEPIDCTATAVQSLTNTCN